MGYTRSRSASFPSRTPALRIGLFTALLLAVLVQYSGYVGAPYDVALVCGTFGVVWMAVGWQDIRHAITRVTRLPFACFLGIWLVLVGHVLVGDSATFELALYPFYTGFVALTSFVLVPRLVRPRQAYRTIAGIGAVLGVFGLLVLQLNLTTLFPAFRNPAWAPSVFVASNSFSVLALVGGLASIDMLVRDRMPIPVGALLLTFNAAFLLLTKSRGGFLAFGVGLVVYLVWFGLGPRRTTSLVATVLGGGSVSVLMMAVFSGTNAVAAIPSTNRAILWHGALNAILARPVFGHGMVDIAPFLTNYLPVTLPREFGPHNSYLHVGIRTGFVGLLAYLGLVWGTLATLLRQSKSAASESDTTPAVSTASTPLLVAVLTALAVNLFVEHYYPLSLGIHSVLLTMTLGYSASTTRTAGVVGQT